MNLKVRRLLGSAALFCVATAFAWGSGPYGAGAVAFGAVAGWSLFRLELHRGAVRLLPGVSFRQLWRQNAANPEVRRGSIVGASLGIWLGGVSAALAPHVGDVFVAGLCGTMGSFMFALALSSAGETPVGM